MKYNKVQGLSIYPSEIGIGTEYLDKKESKLIDKIINASISGGINIIDLFMPGNKVRQDIGKAIKGKRNKLIIQGHIGSIETYFQYDVSRDIDLCDRYFRNLLTNLGTDYIDVGMMFFIDSEDEINRILSNGYYDYVHKLKLKGIINKIGASSHNPVIALKLVELGLIDWLMFSINPAFDIIPLDAKSSTKSIKDIKLETAMTVKYDLARQELYQVCKVKGVPVTAMKVLCSGKIISSEHTLFMKPLTVSQCIQFALTRPSVVSAFIGFEEEKHVYEALNYSFDDNILSVDVFRASPDQSFAGQCVYCNHCQPCPQGINISQVIKYYDMCKVKERPLETIRLHYFSLAKRAEDCVKCRNCEKRCPFHVKVTNIFEEFVSKWLI